MSPVKEDLVILKRAQELDGQLYLILGELDAIPTQREKNKMALEAEKAHWNELEASLKKIQLKQKEKEGELIQKEANIKKLDGQLGQVKTNKEYQALQQEIASLKADNSLLEEEIIGILDEVEATQEQIRNEKEKLKQREKEFENLEQELIQRETVLKGNFADLKKQREEIVNQLPPETRELYERIVKNKRGLALVKIAGEMCGACQIRLRPQIINEVYLAENIVVCENCSRILYAEE